MLAYAALDSVNRAGRSFYALLALEFVGMLFLFGRLCRWTYWVGRCEMAGTVRLTWKDTSDIEHGFTIDRLTGSNYVNIATVGPNIQSYTDFASPLARLTAIASRRSTPQAYRFRPIQPARRPLTKQFPS